MARGQALRCPLRRRRESPSYGRGLRAAAVRWACEPGRVKAAVDTLGWRSLPKEVDAGQGDVITSLGQRREARACGRVSEPWPDSRRLQRCSAARQSPCTSREHPRVDHEAQGSIGRAGGGNVARAQRTRQWSKALRSQQTRGRSSVGVARKSSTRFGEQRVSEGTGACRETRTGEGRASCERARSSEDAVKRNDERAREVVTPTGC